MNWMDGSQIPLEKPLLLAIGRGGAHAASNLPSSDSFQVVILDTDSRTRERYPGMQVIDVGGKLVRGEGAGGNMNLARACFKVDMENIAPVVIGRPLVMIMSSCSGATGIAGSVEISQLLAKVGMPFFNILLHSPGQKMGGLDPLHLASILLDGPLRPGMIVTGREDADDTNDPFGMNRPVSLLLSVSGRSDPFHIPPKPWADMREDGGPFELGFLELVEPYTRMVVTPPAVVSLQVPQKMPTGDVKAMVETTFGSYERVSLGMTTDMDIENVQCAFISRSASQLPSPQGNPPDPESLKDILDTSLEWDLNPRTNIAH
ncbi:MAG: hypothetical protein ACMUHB_05345 [Thermoplasmatota archaeon]